MNWSEQVVLVTGGTGSFGKKFTELMLREYRPQKLIVFSRDELKQHDMRCAGFDHPSLRYFLGDVRDPQRLFTPGQLGRTCPFEVPEGPNLGRIFTIAVGATIRDRRLIVLDTRPAATLGLSASMIPFLEHDNVPGLMMGANMQRQWLPPPDPEPALVQTGAEPDALWCGRNLLTAFIAWDGDTF